MFENISIAPVDPILGLLDAFYADKRLTKINLSIGVYKDETGNTPILQSVKKAESLLLERETSKNYLNIDGLFSFVTNTQRLLFGDNHPIIVNQRACSVQTPGGTGALRIAADFLRRNTTARCIWISNPSWPNHKNVFVAAGFIVRDYSYYNSITRTLDFDSMLSALAQAKFGDVVLFHACCHNPTGIDPTKEQWNELATLSIHRGWLPIFDFAYQGFAHDLEEDAIGLRIFCKVHEELIVCNSFSKNFGLYNERVGSCTLVTPDSTIANRVLSQLKVIIRSNYSNPPVHGAAIVITILTDKVLRTIWENELRSMRNRIQYIRKLFVKTLLDQGAKQDFSFINKQNGMFSFIGLTQKQVLLLRDKAGVYIVDSGRINLAGINLDNIVPLCKAITAVL